MLKKYFLLVCCMAVFASCVVKRPEPSSIARPPVPVDAPPPLESKPDSKPLPPIYRVTVRGKYGFIDRSGKFVVRPDFDTAYVDPAEKVIVVQSQGKFGLLECDGTPLVSPVYTQLTEFSEGLARAKLDGQFGFIDRNGRFVIKAGDGVPNFEAAQPFSEGLAAVQIGEKWGYIDKSGRLVVEPRFYGTGDFSNGIAWVHTEKRPESILGHSLVWNLIDRTGRVFGPRLGNPIELVAGFQN